jgi:hypothetical protein
LRDAGRDRYGLAGQSSAGRRVGESVQVLGGVGVELQHRGQRVQHLRGRMVVAALFQSQVVVAADAREQCQFLAA